MKILFDQGTPLPLAGHRSGHSVETAGDLGWAQLENGALLLAAEQAGFDRFLSTDPEPEIPAEPRREAAGDCDPAFHLLAQNAAASATHSANGGQRYRGSLHRDSNLIAVWSDDLSETLRFS